MVASTVVNLQDTSNFKALPEKTQDLIRESNVFVYCLVQYHIILWMTTSLWNYHHKHLSTRLKTVMHLRLQVRSSTS